MTDRIRQSDRRSSHPAPHPRSYYAQPRTQEVEMFGQAADILPYDHPAFDRTLDTNPITFECQQCHQIVTQQRYPGPTPKYCGQECYDAATVERRREQTRERVRRLRERRKQSTQM